MSDNKKLAKKIVKAVLYDLNDRCGIKHTLAGIEPDVYKELKAELVVQVKAVLNMMTNTDHGTSSIILEVGA